MKSLRAMMRERQRRRFHASGALAEAGPGMRAAAMDMGGGLLNVSVDEKWWFCNWAGEWAWLGFLNPWAHSLTINLMLLTGR